MIQIYAGRNRAEDFQRKYSGGSAEPGHSSFITYCSAPESGIVVYSTDGYETLAADQITEEMFDESVYQKNSCSTTIWSPRGIPSTSW